MYLDNEKQQPKTAQVNKKCIRIIIFNVKTHSNLSQNGISGFFSTRFYN